MMVNNHYGFFFKKSLETVPEVRQEHSRNRQTQLCSTWGIYNADRTDYMTRQSNKLLPAPCSGSTGIRSPMSPASSVQGAWKSFIHPPTACWDQDSMKLATYLLLYFPDRLASVGKLPLPLSSLSPPGNHTQSAGLFLL